MTLTTKQINEMIYSSPLPWYIQDRLVSKTLLFWIKSNPLPFIQQVKECTTRWSLKLVPKSGPYNIYYWMDWAHIDSPIENYPLNIGRMWNEELRSHCREVTGKKRLKKSLSRPELINMIIKA